MDWEQIAWVATAIGTMGTLVGVIIALRRNRKDDLARRIGTEVEAKIGNVLINLRALEAEVHSRLTELLSDLAGRQQALSNELSDRETAMRGFLERAAEAATQIETLLQRAASILPTVETAELVPFQIYLQARESTNPIETTALLVKVLEHPESEPHILEMSGDIARMQLSNRSLARKLYQRAVDVDPQHLSAKSELLRLLAGDVSHRVTARDELIALAQQNPNNKIVVNNALNLLIDLDEWETIVNLCESILPFSKWKATLWRNIAVAWESMGQSHEEVSEAYSKAFEFLGSHNSSSDRGTFVNTARPYVRYLMDRGDVDKAEEVLTRAVLLDPSEAQLHSLRGELARKRGHLSEAKESFELVKMLGDPGEVAQASRALRDIEILQHLRISDVQVEPAAAPAE